MIKYKNLYLIGTSHISKESIREVERVIKKFKPEIIALELDQARFNLLETKKKRKINFSDLKRLGLKIFLLNLAGAWFEKKLGQQVGTEPGAEMKKAIEIAKKQNIRIGLIDQDIKYTLSRFLSKITRREKWQFIKDLILGNKGYSFNAKKVPSEEKIEKIIKKLRKDYPSFYQTIIKERNEFMAKNLYKLTKLYTKDKIVCVVGAGHEKAIMGEIKLLEKIF